MPRALLMSWEGPPYFRWVKMKAGLRHRVTCEDLGLPREQWTKEASYQKANAWWYRKAAELAASSAVLVPHPEATALVETRIDYAKRHGLADEVVELEKEKERLHDADAVPEIDEPTGQKIERLKQLGYELPTDPVLLGILFGREAVWADRLKTDATAPPERTVGALVTRFVKDRQDEAAAGVRSADGADNIRICLVHFQEFCGSSSPVDCLTYDLWHRWYVHCAGAVVKRDRDPSAGWSVDYAKKTFGVARSFVRWLSDKDILVAPPKNLVSKKHTFERGDSPPPIFATDEVKALLAGAGDYHRLLLLLMLNCGFTQKDISDLKKVEINNGRITRRRSKMEKKKASVLVSYKLWPETQALLEKFLAPDGDRALVTKSGRPWVHKRLMDDGKLKKADSMASIFTNLKRKIGMKGASKSLKVFRKTSATRLRSSKDYRDLRFFFLGHSARTIADTHYAGVTQEMLDEAIDWLRGEFLS